jgi:hypothetical protein
VYDCRIERIFMDTHPSDNALVTAREHGETFTVFAVREKKKTADLKSIPTPGNPSYLLQDVPWSEISYFLERQPRLVL